LDEHERDHEDEGEAGVHREFDLGVVEHRGGAEGLGRRFAY
jgi:hypothetical protein